VYKQFSKDGKVVDHDEISVANAARDVYEDWVRLSKKFVLLNHENRIELSVTSDNKMTVSSFLLRPADAHIFYNERADSSFIMDNFLIPARENRSIPL
jgi:hypothetical protein